MIHSSAKLYTGYMQVQHIKYWDEPSTNHTFVLNESLFDKIAAIPHIESLTPRLESFALVSFEKITKASRVIGIAPEKEEAMNNLSSHLVKGRFLKKGDTGTMIAAGLARRLKADLGDTLVFYGQGYHGQIAAGLFPITGIVELPFPDMNNGVVYISLEATQNLYSAYGRISSLAIMIDKSVHQQTINAATASLLPENTRVLNWQEMLPEMKESIEIDNYSGLVMLGILYLIIAFGIFGTIVMMTQERIKEFGILVAVGMAKIRLMAVTLLESLLISSVGAIIGFSLSIPIDYYFYFHPIKFTGKAAEIYLKLGIEPIMAFSTDWSIFFSQAVIIFCIAIVASIYPLTFIRKLEPQKALHS
jgi:ABC-type lipoprotein release transport system permease subunit